VLDSIPGAVAAGLVGSVVAGPVVAYALSFVPPGRRRAADWALIIGAVLFAILADVLTAGPGASGTVAYAISAFPGLITYLVFRSLLASSFVSLAPMYFLIAVYTRTRATHTPEIALDRLMPVEPAWMLVYGSLYMFMAVLPMLVVRQRDLVSRALRSYLTVMAIAYAGFLLYPTSAPRPAQVTGDGFAEWALRIAYSIDPPYNCFPSLHVAYSFVSALTCFRVHRHVGVVAIAWAALIALSTVYTKQHWVVDVAAGAACAVLAYMAFLRGYPRAAVGEIDRRRAPFRAAVACGLYALTVLGAWLAYLLGFGA
jgi:membrane-associated phospholipid phosphatase